MSNSWIIKFMKHLWKFKSLMIYIKTLINKKHDIKHRVVNNLWIKLILYIFNWKSLTLMVTFINDKDVTGFPRKINISCVLKVCILVLWGEWTVTQWDTRTLHSLGLPQQNKIPGPSLNSLSFSSLPARVSLLGRLPQYPTPSMGSC